jgi:exopolysaccharide biosynthesis polyprenyl glycosylphosphotransferase
MIPRRYFWFFDLGIVVVAFVTAHWLGPSVAHHFAPFASASVLAPLSDSVWVLLVMAPSTVLFLGLFGNHTTLLFQSRTRIVVGCIVASFVSVGLVALILFALKDPEWSRLFIFSFGLQSALGLASYRLALRHYFTLRLQAGCYAKNVVLIGVPLSLRWMSKYLAENIPPTDRRLIGYLETCAGHRQSCPQQEECARVDLGGLERIGIVEELGDLLIHRPIHEVIAVQPSCEAGWVREVIKQCGYFGVLLRIVPDALLFGEPNGLKILYPLQPLHLPAVVLTPLHFEGDSEALFLKRLFDIAVSIALLVALVPLFVFVAIAIKLTAPQLPVFYPWIVVGCNGVEFTGYKFTTMFRDADERKKELTDQNEMTGPVFKIKNDPRVTALGRILRKFSINELPQLWSVLKGDMSLVGPRPAFRYELERYEFWHKRKLTVRPGITCLWQIRGRNKVSNFDDWVRMDLEYIDHWSFWLDLKILWRTFWVVIAGTGS